MKKSTATRVANWIWPGLGNLFYGKQREGYLQMISSLVGLATITVSKNMMETLKPTVETATQTGTMSEVLFLQLMVVAICAALGIILVIMTMMFSGLTHKEAVIENS